MDVKSAMTLENYPLVEELKLKIGKMHSPSEFQFQLFHQRAVSNCPCTFYTHGQFFKKRSCRLLKDGILTEILNEMSTSWIFLLVFTSCVASILKATLVNVF